MLRITSVINQPPFRARHASSHPRQFAAATQSPRRSHESHDDPKNTQRGIDRFLRSRVFSPKTDEKTELAHLITLQQDWSLFSSGRVHDVCTQVPRTVCEEQEFANCPPHQHNCQYGHKPHTHTLRSRNSQPVHPRSLSSIK